MLYSLIARFYLYACWHNVCFCGVAVNLYKNQWFSLVIGFRDGQTEEGEVNGDIEAVNDEVHIVPLVSPTRK